MESKQLLDQIKRRFPVTFQIDDFVLRATKQYESKPYALLYFDVSKRFLHPDFDLLTYQQDLLATEYYASTGALQWNMYLFLLCDPAELHAMRTAGVVDRLETNRVFARKIVLTPDQLSRELTEPDTIDSESGIADSDLAVRWIERLKLAHLDGVFMDQGYLNVVDAYLAGTPILEPVEKEQPPSEEERPIGFLRQLEMKNYRSFVDRVVDFGTVNLIQGANGAGKTSLMEAIELCICGASFRNPERIEMGADLSLAIQGNATPEKYDPSLNALYRTRDLQWYGNYYMRGNRLCYGFNRFNHYDTDAAARLVHSDASNEALERSISSLLIGQTANSVHDRAEKFFAEFQARLRLSERNAGDRRAAIARLNLERKRLLAPAVEPGPLRDVLIRELGLLNWKKNIATDSRELLDLLINDLDDIDLRLQTCVSVVSWLTRVTRSQFREQTQDLRLDLEQLTRIRKDAIAATSKRDELVKRQADARQSLELVSALEPYVRNAESRFLVGLCSRLATAEREFKSYSDAWALVENVNLQLFESRKETAIEIERQLANEIAETSTRSRLLSHQAETMRQNSGRARSLRSELRSTTLELLELVQQIHECPICRTPYEKRDLIGRLTADDSKQDDPQLTDILNSISVSEKKLSSLREERQQAINIAHAIEIVGKDPSTTSLSDSVSLISVLQSRIAEKQADRDRLNGIKQRLESGGLSETTLVNLLRTLNKVDIPFPSGAFNEFFEQTKREQASILTDITPELEIIQEYVHVATRERTILLERLGLGDDINAVEATLRERQASLQHATVLLDEVAQLIEINGEEPIEHILVRTRSTRNAANNFAATLSPVAFQSRLNELQAEINRNESDLAQAQEQQTRARMACEALDDILTVNSREKYLQKFLEVHKNAILRVFRRIHAPHEFGEIEFHRNGKMEMFLLTENDRHRRRLSEVSTGQRAALALSVFLALNNLLKAGPPLILLDDPVAHVDDLNTLSFFDYLRDIAVRHKRQIIFATANNKLANLFRKKFDFLGKEFKEIELDRSSRS